VPRTKASIAGEASGHIRRKRSVDVIAVNAGAHARLLRPSGSLRDARRSSRETLLFAKLMTPMLLLRHENVLYDDFRTLSDRWARRVVRY
jgi:hypothetical protein